MTETPGQVIDAEIAVVKARIAALEAAGKTDWAKVKAWVQTNWPHFVTWISAALVVVKTDALSIVTKLL